MMSSFFQLTLRTLDVEAARTFYTQLLGDVPLHIVKLHEQAVARGATAHWLGYLRVDDVDGAAAAFVKHGATPLAPKWVNPEGVEAAVMRDPGGAVVALARPAPGHDAGAASRELSPRVLWYELNTSDVELARASYRELFGWTFDAPMELAELGTLHPFAWERGGPSVGSMAGLAGRPAVHAHWLFHLRVASLSRAMQTVVDAGGKVIGPITLPGGEQVAVCDDPQGAAFAMREGS